MGISRERNENVLTSWNVFLIHSCCLSSAQFKRHGVMENIERTPRATNKRIHCAILIRNKNMFFVFVGCQLLPNTMCCNVLLVNETEKEIEFDLMN